MLSLPRLIQEKKRLLHRSRSSVTALADKYFFSQDYETALREYSDLLLEARNNIEVLLKLSLCCIKTGDFHRAGVYTDKILSRIDTARPEALLIKAYLDLYNNHTAEALLAYTKLLEQNYEKKRIRRILDAIKSCTSMPAFVVNRSPDYFVPYYRKQISLKKILCLIFIPIAVVSAALIANRNRLQTIISRGTDSLPFTTDVTNKNLHTLHVFQSGQSQSDKITGGLFQSETDSQYTSGEISVQEADRLYKEMKKNISGRLVNEAIIIQNKIQFSTVNLIVKEKFNLLAASIGRPDFSTHQNTVSLHTAVSSEIYRGVWIKCTGTIRDVIKTGDPIIFRFIIDEEGIIWTAEVFIYNVPDGLLEIKKSYEILCRFTGFDKKKKLIILQGAALKEVIRYEQ